MISGEMYSGALRDQLVADLTERVADLRQEGQIVCVDLLNANPDSAPSAKYVDLKANSAQKIGIVPSVLNTYSADRLPEAMK